MRFSRERRNPPTLSAALHPIMSSSIRWNLFSCNSTINFTFNSLSPSFQGGVIFPLVTTLVALTSKLTTCSSDKTQFIAALVFVLFTVKIYRDTLGRMWSREKYLV